VKPGAQPESWRRVTVDGPSGRIPTYELGDWPGFCAGCAFAFEEHHDAELGLCAAALRELTQEAAGCWQAPAGGAA